MLGLLATLNLGTRSLQTQQQGVEVAGQNLANVNNPAYARQRLVIQTSTSVQTSLGPQGTGADATGITQLRDAFLDQQITGETSIMGFLQAQQTALQYAQAGLGEQLAGSISSTDATSSDIGSTGGLANDLAGLFNAFQELSTAPDSMTSRQMVVAQAQQLTAKFNRVSQQLGAINDQLNQSVKSDVNSANDILSAVANLNQQIRAAESAGGAANDLRDLRQQKLEQLANIANFQSATTSNGDLNISIDGQILVSGAREVDTLYAYDPGNGQLQLMANSSTIPISLTGGALAGAIDARDGALTDLRNGLDAIAAQLIASVNQTYSAGYDLHDNTGALFFTGDRAGNIAVQADLADDPSLLQASGQPGDPGNNQIALSLAQLGQASLSTLANQTFSGSYNNSLVALGSALSTVNTQLTDQQTVQNMLQNQRTSVSGVSIDEEMTDLLKYQRAFQASAHLVSTVDEMLNEVVNLKQ